MAMIAVRVVCFVANLSGAQRIYRGQLIPAVWLPPVGRRSRRLDCCHPRRSGGTASARGARLLRHRFPRRLIKVFSRRDLHRTPVGTYWRQRTLGTQNRHRGSANTSRRAPRFHHSAFCTPQQESASRSVCRRPLHWGRHNSSDFSFFASGAAGFRCTLSPYRHIPRRVCRSLWGGLSPVWSLSHPPP